MNELMINAPELGQVEKSKAAQIRATFEPMAAMLETFEGQFNQLVAESQQGITEEITARAKRLRLDISRVRIETGKLKDQQKEQIKREDRAIMGVHNLLVWAVKDKEEKLKEIENYFAEQERKRLEALQAERVALLEPYDPDASLRSLNALLPDEFDALLAMKKRQHEEAIEAARIAEEQRKEAERKEAEERQRIAEENARLKAEAEAREKELEAERKRQQAIIDAERKAREEAEAKAKAEREALEAQLKAKEAAERKAREEAERAEQQRLAMGDAAKKRALIDDLNALATKYEFKAKTNQLMYADVQTLLQKIVNHISK